MGFSISKIFNRWAAATKTPNRSSSLPNRPVGPKVDNPSAARRTIIAKAREFERNSPIVQAMLHALRQYGTHSGINPIPATRSKTFNSRALDVWEEWVEYADVMSRLDFYSMQRIVDRRAFIDGDIFSLLVNGESGKPRIQLVESHRCQSVYTSDSDRSEFDGVLFDAIGRPTGFRFFEDSNMASATDVDASRVIDAQDVVQHYCPHRSGQLRGFSDLASVLDTIQDIEEIESAEMTAVKDHSSLIKAVYNENGEVEGDDTKDHFTDELYEVQGESDAVVRQETEYYEQKLGSETVYMRRNGDRVDLLTSNRPSAAWQGFIKHEMRKAFVGTGLSLEICWEPSDQGGATMRFQVEKDTRYMSIRQDDRIREYKRIYNFVIGRHIDMGLLTRPPRDWWKANWKKPRKASVDYGKDAKATVSLYRLGGTTLEDFHGDEGNDWRKVMQQRAEEVRYAAELAKKMSAGGVKVSRQEILQLDDNEISANAGSGNTDTSASNKTKTKPESTDKDENEE